MPIVSAVDGSDRSTAVVERGADLARAYDVDHHVVHVASLSDATGRDNVGGPTLELDRATNEARQVAESVAASATGTDQYEPVGLVGDIVHELLTYCDEIGAEYIVVSGRKRSPIGKLVFGSVTQSLLLQSHIPVVSVTQTNH